jgi:DNA-binding CsgD family transcriptional regulator
MSTAPIVSDPEVPSTSLPEIAFLRRVDVLDSDLRVLLRGTARDSLVEGNGELLPPATAAEIDAIVRTHDFTRRPIATGLVGAELALRIVRTTGPAGSFYTVFTERILLRRNLAKLALRFRMTPGELELLRLVAGGYPFAEMVRRLELPPTTVRTQLRELEEKVGCFGRKELAKLALRYSEPGLNLPSPAPPGALGSNTYLGRGVGIRHR